MLQLYSTGATNYFFATNDEEDGYSLNAYVEVRYSYDEDTIISITYENGEYSYTDAVLSGAHNGIKNAGSYTIRAVVAETENYQSWSSSINVEVAKGEIGNVYLVGYSTPYSASRHYLYVSNQNKATTEYENVLLPDGTIANVEYGTVGQYLNANITETYNLDWGTANNYAQDAGIYVVNARIANNRNYNDLPQPLTAQMSITKCETDVIWRYSGSETANFT